MQKRIDAERQRADELQANLEKVTEAAKYVEDCLNKEGLRAEKAETLLGELEKLLGDWLVENSIAVACGYIEKDQELHQRTMDALTPNESQKAYTFNHEALDELVRETERLGLYEELGSQEEDDA